MAIEQESPTRAQYFFSHSDYILGLTVGEQVFESRAVT